MKEQFLVSSASENAMPDYLAPCERKNDRVSLTEKILLARNCLFASSKSVILPSAIVMIRLHDGKFKEAKTLLDLCSQINSISTELAKHR